MGAIHDETTQRREACLRFRNRASELCFTHALMFKNKWDAVERVPPADYFRWRENQTGKLRLSGGVLCIVPSQRMSPAAFLRVSSMRAVNWASVYSSSNNLPVGFWPSSRNVRPFCVYVPLTRPRGPNRNRNTCSPRRLRSVQRSGPPEQSLSVMAVVSLESEIELAVAMA